MKTSRIALKPYIDRITGYCEPLSKKELTDVIIGLAKRVPTSGRVEFLDQIESNLSNRRRRSKVRLKADKIEQIINGIEVLKESIEERIESIEDGSFWDGPEAWEYDGYYDEVPEYVGDDHKNEMASFFTIADSLFLDDDINGARSVYEALFSIAKTFADYDGVSPGFDIDIREARARYCRCVYETSDTANRLSAFSEAMEIDVYLPYNVNAYDENYPLLQDVIDARPRQLPDMEIFMPAWKEDLATRGTKGRPAVLLLEAVNHLQGLKGVSRLARKWKNSQPQGYLFWLDILKKNDDSKGIIKVGSEGLKALKAGSFRERVAECVITAAQKVKNTEQILYGKRERFFSHTSDQNLLEYLHEATQQDVNAIEIKKAIKHFKAIKSMDSDQKILYVKTLLMAGQLEAAFAMVKKEKAVGWSYYSSAGVVFGAILSVFTNHDEKCATLKTLLKEYANQLSVYSNRICIDNETDVSFYQAILTGLKQKRFSKVKKVEYFTWAKKIGKKRIEHIVSNKHRNAYDRAAQVLGTLAEVYLATGQKKKAARIVQRYYNEKFRRFRAFRREVAAVFSESDQLRSASFFET